MADNTCGHVGGFLTGIDSDFNDKKPGKKNTREIDRFVSCLLIACFNFL